MTLSAHHYALLSRHVYQGNRLKPGIQVGSSGWTVCRTFTGRLGYFSAIFLNQRSKRLVLSHRGTDSIGALLTDLKGIVNHRYTKQQTSGLAATEAAIDLAKKTKLPLVFTGHSLGAWHAEQSLVYAHLISKFYQSCAVSFESPGSFEMLSKLFQSNINAEDNVFLRPNIIEYLSYPNIINTFNHHVGTLIHVRPFLFHSGRRLHHSSEAHSIENLVEALSENSVKLSYMNDWPLGLQYLSAKSTKKPASQLFQSHFRIDPDFNPHYDVPLHHLEREQAIFLQHVDDVFGVSKANRNQRDQLRKAWMKLGVNPKFISLLLNYKITKHQKKHWLSIRSHDFSMDHYQQYLNDSKSAIKFFQLNLLGGSLQHQLNKESRGVTAVTPC